MISFEKMLKTAADASKMGSWNDMLSGVTEASSRRCAVMQLSDKDLEKVAGGVYTDSGPADQSCLDKPNDD